MCHHLKKRMSWRAGFWLTAIVVSSPSVSAETLDVPSRFQTIQQAVNAAQPGDVVLVQPGIYRERVRLKRGVVLRSAGDNTKGKLGLKRAEATIIDGRFPRAEGPGVLMAEDAVLDGFTVTGVGRYDDALWKKHHATRGEEQAHEHIGAPGTAGIAVTGIERCTVINNVVHHIGYTGIAITGAPGKNVSPRIMRNVAYRNMGGGIGSMKGSTALIEENICFQNFYAGIGNAHASPVIRNNICYENIRAGIGISEGSCPLVKGNQCFRNRRAGIGIRTGKETAPLVEDNVCYENGMAGIGARDNATPLIRGNHCYKNEMAGIGCRTGARPVIVGNRCDENAMVGIGVQQKAVATVIGNICRRNHQAGIGIREKSSALLLRNKCLENRLVAIGVRTLSSARLMENELQRSGGMPPLIAVREGSRAEIMNNTLHGGGVAGVMVQGTADIRENRFVGNGPRRGPGPPHFAVWVQTGSEVVVSRNHFDRWRHAVFARGAKKLAVFNNSAVRFLDAAFVLHQSQNAAHAFGNTAFSDKADDKAVVVEKPLGVVAENVIRPLKEHPHHPLKQAP